MCVFSSSGVRSKVAQHHDVHIPTLRLYSVYGPFEEPTRFVPTLITHGLEGRLPPLVSPDIARDFVYADDVANAFLRAAKRSDDKGVEVERGAIYNVGTGKQTTIREAVSLARASLAIDIEPDWSSMKNREWDATTWVADPSKIEKELGWKARVSFAEGLTRFTSWVNEHPARYQT